MAQKNWKELINGSNNIVFLAGPVSRQKAGFLIFEVRTDFITRRLIIRRKPFLSHSFSCETRKNFIVLQNKMLCLDAKPNTGT